MNKLIAMAALALSTLAASCAGVDDMVKYGGEGKFAFVNAAAGVPAGPLDRAAKAVGNLLMIHTGVVPGSWTLATARKSLAASGATAAVFVVRDPSLPMSLVAIEEKWGVVNAEGLSDKQLEKEALRVATTVLGGAASKFATSVMRPVFSKDDLSTKAGDVVAFDSLMAISTYLPGLGIKPYLLLTREEAIKDGIIEK